MELVTSVFGPAFHTPAGWTYILGQLDGGTVSTQLKMGADFWSLETFQALYVGSWIHNPVEKGTFMISLPGNAAQIVQGACKRLLKEKEMAGRVSSHMSKKGYSASRNWNFLSGYGELLVQIEGGLTSYLFLKSEGHPLSMKDPVGAGKHLKAWGTKIRTGEGEMANPALNELARSSPTLVERRAAENYSVEYKAFLKQLKLKGKLVTVEEVVTKLCGLLDDAVLEWGYGLGKLQGNSQLLGQAMLDPNRGFLKTFQLEKETLSGKKVEYTDQVHQELSEIAKRMATSPCSHSEQVFNEVRLTAADIDQSLAIFKAHLIEHE
jgi:hypothetical protein